jgi:hypothetical protein
MSEQIWNKIYIAHAILGNNRLLESGVWIYTYAGGTPSGLELSLSSDRTGGILGPGGARRGGGAPVPLPVQRVNGFSALPFCQRRQLSV